MTGTSDPIRFFDIASAPPVRTYAPNPWKTRYATNLAPKKIEYQPNILRYALNAKALPYTTEWVELPDVKAIRLKYGVAPVRKLPNDEDFYTLPMIYDPSTDAWIGDSFDIAVYLDRQYPDSGVRLFPPGSEGVHRVFNAHVDALFTRHVVLCFGGLPFNPETAEMTKAEFCRRFKVDNYDDFNVKGEARVQIIQAFEADMDEFSKLWKFDESPFLEREKMSYADLIVGGWLAMMKECLIEEEWERLCQWSGGRWGRLHKAMERWADMK
jgi:glutathione S-transferase